MLEWLTVEGRLTDGLPMRLYIAGRNDQICAACLHDDTHPRTPDEFEWRLHGRQTAAERISGSPKSELLHLAERQISEYFSGRRLQFDVPLRWQGTTFQIRVWRELARIPFGTTRSYQEIAEQIGNPKAARPVGSANGKNRLPLFVPCHRVVAAGGKLGGFTGGLGLKKRLLAHEAAVLGEAPPL
jgi:methylated-DNA-[protein]-cysteine S-methyltransferase